MALPGVSINVLDGNLGLQPASTSQTMLWMGCCTDLTPNTLSYYGDASTLAGALGAGELLESATYGLKVAGGVLGVMPLNPSTRGGVSAVTKVGTGAETLAVTIAPHKAITITCTTAGALGTAAFTVQLGSAAASQPVTSAASWSSTGYLIPGTYCTVVFTAGSYVAGGTPDIYTISTAGVVAHPQGTGPAVPTFTASPIDYYAPKVSIVTAGALGTMQFTYSLDGTAGNTSAAIVSAGSGVYVIPSTGLVLTFTGSSTVGDYFTFTAAGPTYTSTDLSNALTALQTTYLASAQYSMATVVGSIASASAFATQASSLETAAAALFNNGVYVRFFLGCPTTGTVLPNAGSVTVDSADTDAVVIAARQGMSTPHVVPCAGDFAHNSPVSGLSLRRNAVLAAAARAADVEASQNLGWVQAGGILSATSLYRDENATPGFDAAGLTCLRTFAGAGAGGIYLADAHTGAASTSDYYPVTNARVIDRACGIARLAALPLVNSKVPTTTRNSLPGVITEKKAQQIEQRINAALQAALVDGSPQDAVATAVVVNRTNNVLSTGQLIIAVAVQPFGYARTVTVNLGMTISAS